MRGLCLMIALLSSRAAAQNTQPAISDTPLPIQNIDVPYSDEARVAGLEGRVQVSGSLDDDGTPRDVTVAQPPLGLGLDEKVLETAKLWRFAPDTHKPLLVNIPVDFLLPDKQSRWHLTRVAFDTPNGASRPVFLTAKYPLGSGLALDVGPSPIDEARIVAAVGRQAWAIVSFNVDVNGIPRNFEVPDASMDLWKDQAIALVSQWRFTPGMKDGKPVSVRCMLNLVWGQRNLSAAQLAQVLPAETKTQPQVRSVSPPPISPVKFPPPPPGVERVALPASAQFDNLIKRISPRFPPTPGQTGLGGVILFEVLIGTDGHVRQAFPVDQGGAFIPDATQALMQWIYRPATLNGKSVEVTTTVPIEVPLQKDLPK
jgi:TonB family protein